MRINKYLSDSGSWSRRDADVLLTEGRVTINGSPAGLGDQVAPGDRVCVDGDVVGAARKLAKPIYIAFNKPVGITCTTERSVAGNIIDFIDHAERIFPIGRLDKDSEGLILLTNDGDIVNQVLRVENHHEKEYVVAVDRPVTDEFVQHMTRGIRLRPEGMTKPCKVRRMGPRMFSIILTQGLNRQIRRMCEECGYQVQALRRVRFVHIMLGGLAVGRWRNLTEPEVQKLLSAPTPAKASKPGQRPVTGPSNPSPGSAGARRAAPRSGPPPIANNARNPSRPSPGGPNRSSRGRSR
ncbi:MAG: pseudouridine synthase [Kofleriaceae bacterium]|nr:pseudouridine synthase [Kofleriaceae bacterium]